MPAAAFAAASATLHLFTLGPDTAYDIAKRLSCSVSTLMYPYAF